MGLAGAKQNTKIGKDPRNTHWSNDTLRFGHQHLVRLGWNKGNGLGQRQHGNTSHIKMAVKRDNSGLGARVRNPYKKGGSGDDGVSMAGDDGFIQGLDVFQRILGRLNGEEERVERALGTQRKMVVEENPKFGMRFVYGGLLQGTIDEDGNIIKGGSEKKEKREKKEKKDKKDKKEKKEKKEKKRKLDEDEDTDVSKSKKQKKDKKSKKDKSAKPKDSAKEPAATQSSVAATGSAAPTALKGIHATRARWIRSKRAATMDSKSLGEIFMV